MLTPFEADGEIDYSALDRLIDLYLAAGASGLFANCLSSEMYELSGRERLALVRYIVKRVGDAVPVVATGSFGSTVEEQADFVKRMYDTGVDAVILISGVLATEEEEDSIWEGRVEHLLALTPDVPVGFYECPVPYKRLITPAQLGRFAASGRIRYHKDTCLDIGQVREKLGAVTSPDFGLYDAYIGHAVESLRAGSRGLSCIQGNFFPELIVWLCDHASDDAAAEEAARVQRFFVQHMDVMHRVYPVVAKHALQKRGVDIATFTRRQVGVFDPALHRRLQQLCREAEVLEQRIGIAHAC